MAADSPEFVGSMLWCSGCDGEQRRREMSGWESYLGKRRLGEKARQSGDELEWRRSSELGGGNVPAAGKRR